MFNKDIIPYAKTDDRFWWHALLCTQSIQATQSVGVHPLVCPADIKGSAKAEVQSLPRALLAEAFGDVDWILDDNAPEKKATVIQLSPTTNFLDRSSYKAVTMDLWKFAQYVVTHDLIQYRSEVPKFLTYDLAVFANTPERCLELQRKQSLRNTAANLLTIDKKSLSAAVEVQGKAFVIANGLDLTEDELREIVIFCMGQAETTELKLKTWPKLKDRLQEEAKLFAKSAQHIRGYRV